ncbi:fibronectin type III domain-containing protein [Candidatus Beckwithbacteria bacterium]|nr:fibronectin type III domain-containing protein [Candidatus Beckwithbacteria bacterium]
MKIIKSLILVLFLFTLISSKVYAVNLTVDCSSSNCTLSPSPEAALFAPSEDYNSDIKPGDNIHRTITVNNNRNTNCSLVLKPKNNLGSEPYSLDEVMFTVIKDTTTAYFGSESGGRATSAETLKSLFQNGEINLGIIGANSSRIFDWIVSIDESVGNEYQKASLKFDFDMNFICDDPSPTPTPTSTTTNGGGGTGGGGTGGTPVCTATSPSSAPVLTTRAGAPGSIILSWTAVSPVTHYMIWYGTTPGVYTYGNSNIGNVTSYTVTGLGAGRYYFQVAGVNDCAPGPWSNQSSPTGFVGGVSTQIPSGFEVLGEKTKTPEISGAKENGQVMGEKDGCCPKICAWWWILLLAQTTLVSWFYLDRVQKQKRSLALVVSLVSFVVSFIAHYFLHRLYVNDYGYQASIYCPYFWLMSGISLLILLIANYFVRQGDQDEK